MVSPCRDQSYASQLEEAVESLNTNGASWGKTPREVIIALFNLGVIGIAAAGRDDAFYSWTRSFDEAEHLTRAGREFTIHPGFHRFLEIEAKGQT